MLVTSGTYLTLPSSLGKPLSEIKRKPCTIGLPVNKVII